MKKVLNNLRFWQVAALAIGVLIAQPAFAKERQGSLLRIVRNDGTTVTGELIAVRGNSLLLVEEHSAEGMSISFTEIRNLDIVRETQAVGGAVIGLLGGTLLGACVGYLVTPSSPSSWLFPANFGKAIAAGRGAGIGSLAGLAFGTIIGASRPTHIRLIEEGHLRMTETEVLRKLRSLAKVPGAI
jgi:hypothetical protein